jgi:hypothetical protein
MISVDARSFVDLGISSVFVGVVNVSTVKY